MSAILEPTVNVNADLFKSLEHQEKLRNRGMPINIGFPL
jgi:hypothetical protein